MAFVSPMQQTLGGIRKASYYDHLKTVLKEVWYLNYLETVQELKIAVIKRRTSTKNDR